MPHFILETMEEIHIVHPIVHHKEDEPLGEIIHIIEMITGIIEVQITGIRTTGIMEVQEKIRLVQMVR